MTREKKPGKLLWQGCLANGSKMSVSANRATDGLLDKTEIITD